MLNLISTNKKHQVQRRWPGQRQKSAEPRKHTKRKNIQFSESYRLPHKRVAVFRYTLARVCQFQLDGHGVSNGQLLTSCKRIPESTNCFLSG